MISLIFPMVINQSTFEVYYSGHVQGVGFRYQIFQIAKEFEITGFVHNLPDGRVQLHAQGEVTEVKLFLDEISYQLESFIREIEKKLLGKNPIYREFFIC